MFTGSRRGNWPRDRLDRQRPAKRQGQPAGSLNCSVGSSRVAAARRSVQYGTLGRRGAPPRHVADVSTLDRDAFRVRNNLYQGRTQGDDGVSEHPLS